MKKLLASLLVIFVFLLVSTGSLLAKTLFQETGTVTVAKNEVINDDLFAGGESVNIEGTVNGDVFIGAGTVNIRGKVNGNLHIGAGSVVISGPVSGSIYAGAGTIDLQGAKINGSFISGAGTVNIDKESLIKGSLITGAGTVNNKAPVGRNLMLGAGIINLDSVVGGEAKLGGGKIDLGPNTKIAGDLTYTYDKDTNFTMSDSATVAGEIKKIETKTALGFNKKIQNKTLAGAFWSKFALKLVSLLGAIIVGLLWVKLLPKAAQDVTKQVKNAFLTNLGVGFLVSILALPVFILLAISVIGLPLAGILFCLLMLSLYLSKITVGLWAGSFLSEKFGWKKISPYTTVSLGLIVIYLLISLPKIGFFFSFVTCLTGLGALTIYYRNRLAGKQ